MAQTGFTLNSDHTLTSFDVDTTLLQSNILQTTLLPGANPVSIFPEGASTYVSDPGLNVVSQFTGQPLTLQQQLNISAAFTPIYVAGIASAPRVYAISQRVGGGLGQVSTIETSSNTIDPNPLPVGKNPVYGVMTADARRAFIMNQGDGTVSVINAQTNQLDIVPIGATNPITVGASPLWADFAPPATKWSSPTPATASIRVRSASSASHCARPLLSQSIPTAILTIRSTLLALGTVIATVPVGVNPVMVGVLQDITNTRAYVVNGGNPNVPCGPPTPTEPAGNCTVSVINLNTNTVTATIPLIATPVVTPRSGHSNKSRYSDSERSSQLHRRHERYAHR